MKSSFAPSLVGRWATSLICAGPVKSCSRALRSFTSASARTETDHDGLALGKKLAGKNSHPTKNFSRAGIPRDESRLNFQSNHPVERAIRCLEPRLQWEPDVVTDQGRLYVRRDGVIGRLRTVERAMNAMRSVVASSYRWGVEAIFGLRETQSYA